jgi:hypothetical protein
MSLRSRRRRRIADRLQTALVLFVGAGCTAEGAPDERTAFLYDWADDLAFTDSPSGTVRTWYSERGPNAADTDDFDDDGVPDVAQRVAEAGEGALDFYAFLGFAPPVTERDLGLGPLGGSDALDMYLVAPAATGGFGWLYYDACEGDRCATYVTLSGQDEYPEATVAYQAFGAVLLAYDGVQPNWLGASACDHACRLATGSTGWLECFDGQSYLDHAECGLAKLDGEGECAKARSAAAMLWDYFEGTGHPDAMLRAVEATSNHEGLAILDAAVRELGSRLDDEWPLFAAANLATGSERRPPGLHTRTRNEGWTASTRRRRARPSRTARVGPPSPLDTIGSNTRAASCGSARRGMSGLSA